MICEVDKMNSKVGYCKYHKLTYNYNAVKWTVKYKQTKIFTNKDGLRTW